MSREHWDRADGLLVRAWRAGGDPCLQADILFRRGECLRAMARFQEALPCYMGAARRYRRLRLFSEEGRALVGASACLRLVGRYHAARALWKKAGLTGLLKRDVESRVDISLERALVARGQGRWGEARRWLRVVFPLLKDYSHDPARQHAFWILGGLERFSGRLKEARSAFQQAARLSAAMRDPSARAYALCGLAGVERVLGDGASSLARYREAHRFFKKCADPFGQAYGLCGQANAMRVFGSAQKSVALYKKSAGIYHRLGDKSSEGFARWGLAGSLRRLKKYAAGHRAYREARRLFSQSRDDRGLVMTLLGESRLLDSLGRAASARRRRLTALQRARSAGLRYELALSRYEAARPLPSAIRHLKPFHISPASLRRWRDIP